ncbi:hypothetical protein N7481_007474 [Penicillium waksmanii]|uniref:uncharacterized protein n=1 Tax=Penicillium waksmanii TaxID=69791 RepID=UPI002547646B|nr:uncharacterized protein N7481_007474 [Penicillium waksmanii]KAJ5980176.1 hypothetical protein N7481_007474 [Penicillium waksmanii]
MKILMLHGSRQSGELFRAKIQRLEKLTRQALGLSPSQNVDFIYPTAPFPLESAGNNSDLRSRHGSWTWFNTESIDGIYPGFDTTLDCISSILTSSGPFDGIIGFSQGAALAIMIASLLEDNRKDSFDRLQLKGGIPPPITFSAPHYPPLKFVVCISGYAASHSTYRAFYDPPIETSILHVLGSMDTIVDEDTSLKLIQCCEDPENTITPAVLRHPGGHTVPGGKRELVAIALFIKSSCVE